MMEYKKHRHDFTEETSEQLLGFAKEYVNTDRKTVKQGWKQWLQDNATHVTTVEDYMTKSGYTGDIITKMYNSVRYYHMKRLRKGVQPNKITLPHTNRFSREFLKRMDQDIIDNLMTKKCENDSPITLTNRFCANNREEVLAELKRILDKNGDMPDNMGSRLKKAYKARYYLLRVHPTPPFSKEGSE